MPAGLAYAFVYHECTRNLDENARLKVDAILGDKIAAARIQASRHQASVDMGVEVG